ncbi:MAG: hypothetical protein IJO63_02370 [Bacilli bacterium]|nr:hypothetical protein [Bacilli bacterium]
MKNKSLMIIVFVSVVVFTALLFSIYKIATKDATVFYKNGYVSISDSEKSEKIYFTEGTSYKRGYGKEVIFKDKDDVKQEVGKYNFVFYEDKSINFLTDGVLLDLNQVGSAFVPYYNIKSNYLIEYNSGKYVIDSTEKDIVIDNFIGRINDSKYIVAGNGLKLKLSSSEELISDYYFELNFIDGQTVKIDNGKLNIETISDEAYIMVGDKIKIDLSKQVIFYENEAKINLSEIIINHNENIDILYEEPELGSSGGGSGDGGNQTGGNGQPGEGGGQGSGGSGQTGGSTPEYEVETVIEYKNIPYVELLNSSVNSHKINLEFNVIDKNNLISGPVTVRYVNLQTGEIVNKTYTNYSGTIDYIADGLRSNTDYLVTIFASYVRNNAIFNDYTMFQRTFSTRDLGLDLVKDYVTSDELSYNINFSENATFTNATLNLYDTQGNLIESYDFTNNGQSQNVTFSGLKSNTKYTAKIENVTYGNVVYTGGAAVTLENKTLKFNPFKDGSVVASPIAITNKKDYNIKFDLGAIVDDDATIKGVTYVVYDKETDEVVKSIKKETLNPIEVKTDEDIKNHHTYYYKAVISLNDNEKNIDYETLASNDFNLDAKMSPTMRFTTTGVTSNSLNGYFTITDSDNAIDTTKNIYVEYVNSLGVSDTKMLEYNECPDEESETTKCAYLELSELTSDEVYTIGLMAFVDLESEEIEAGYTQIGAIKLMTEKADIILTDMSARDLDEIEAFEKVFEVNMQFSIDETTSETVRDNMSGFDIMLYEGADATGMYLGSIHIGAETNIVEEFFNNAKTFTLKDFGLTLDDLIKLHITQDGQISKKYTIKLTNGKSGVDYVEFKPYSLTFEINDVLLGLSNNDATIAVTPILNSEKPAYREDALNGDTIIGLKVTPSFGNKKYVTEINFVIRDITTAQAAQMTYSDKLEIDEGSIIPVYEFMFKDYPDFFKRGRIYQVEYTVKLDLNDDGETDLVYPFSSDDIETPTPVKSLPIEVPKQIPSMILFPWVSDTNSVSFKYNVTDVDGALPDGYKVYYEIGESSLEGEAATCANSSDLKGKNYTSKYDCVKFTGLNNGDVYNVYLNPILIEAEGTEATRVDINNFTFEGVYDISNVRFDLELNELGSSKYNNLFSLKISEPYDSLTEEEKLLNKQLKNRIAFYTLELAIEGSNKKFVINNITNSARITSPISSNMIDYYEGASVKASWRNTSKYDNLSRIAYVGTCDDEVSTCLYVDYSKLYNSTTFKNVFGSFKNANLTVSLSAMYDSGNISYLANGQGKYAFQVMSNEIIEQNGQVYNDNYLSVHGITLDKVTFSPSALSAVYAYANSKGGFVDDNADDNNIGSGKIYFINTIYSNLIPTQSTNFINPSYVVTNRGIEVTFGYGALQVTLPIVAKELKSSTINGIGNFKFDRVIPSINVMGKANIINGIKVNLGLSGITENDIDAEEDGNRYVFVEVYDKETDAFVKELKVNKDYLTIQKGTVVDGRYKLVADSDYKFDITAVRTTAGAVENYSYDHRTGIITFDETVTDNTEITVEYRIVIDKLNVGTTYYLKAYMKMAGQKTYLVDTTSSTYATFNYEFTTKTAEEVSVSNAALDTVSETDYATRYLTTNYKIDDIVGIDNLEYQICNDDNSICVDASKYKACDISYNNYDGTCFTKNGSYLASIYHDISISEDLDFEFNTNYNLVINAVVEELDGQVNKYEIYNNSLNLRALKNPSVNVIKNAEFKDGKNPYLSFDILFTDPDRVISKPEVNKENGQYIAYLATGADKVKIEGTEFVLNVTENGLDMMTTLTYENLDVNSAYYLMIDYKTYTNNVGGTVENVYSVPYLIYTLGDNGISVGRIEYSALSNTSILKFGYATNMTRDYISLEDGSLIPDPDQEAYVAGIVYHITRTSGDNLFAIDGTLIFDENNKVEHKNDSSSSETIGDNYYQITIPNTNYPVGAGYSILFQFYLGGNVASGLTTESLCLDNSVSNYWNATTNECYILDDTKYDAYTMYESGKAA